MTPLEPTYVGNPIDINPDQTQFTLGGLTTWESRKLQELQHLNMLTESLDPDLGHPHLALHPCCQPQASQPEQG